MITLPASGRNLRRFLVYLSRCWPSFLHKNLSVTVSFKQLQVDWVVVGLIHLNIKINESLKLYNLTKIFPFIF